MNVEIQANDDENFKIRVKRFGEQFIATDSERVVIAETKENAVEGVKELQEQNESIVASPKAVPLENYRTTNSIGWFEGTSWSTKN